MITHKVHFPQKIQQVLKINHEVFCPVTSVTSALIRAGVAVLGPLVILISLINIWVVRKNGFLGSGLRVGADRVGYQESGNTP